MQPVLGAAPLTSLPPCASGTFPESPVDDDCYVSAGRGYRYGYVHMEHTVESGHSSRPLIGRFLRYDEIRASEFCDLVAIDRDTMMNSFQLTDPMISPDAVGRMLMDAQNMLACDDEGREAFSTVREALGGHALSLNAYVRHVSTQDEPMARSTEAARDEAFTQKRNAIPPPPLSPDDIEKEAKG